MSILLVLWSCSGTASQSDKVLGEWYNESLSVRLDASHGGSTMYEVPPGKWEEILKIKPIQTIYREDGTYDSKYWDLDGTLMRETGGEWELIGDTLFLTDGGVRTGYHFEWLDGKAAFIGYLDWDSDGEADDLYRGVQIKK